jgi:hypothetical protein
VDTTTIAGAVLALGAMLGTPAACEFQIDPITGTANRETPPVGNPPPVTIPGNEGILHVFKIVEPEDADLASEAESGVYESAGPLDDSEECRFIQTRVEQIGPVDKRIEIAVSDPSLDKDQAVQEPEPEVIEDDPTTAEVDLRVELLPGDTFASDGCEDWIKVDEA